MKTLNASKIFQWLGVFALISLILGCNTKLRKSSPAGQEKSGGLDGGGGDIPQSTEGQVLRATDEVFKIYLPNIFYNLGLKKASTSDPYILRILNSFYNENIGQDQWESSQPIFQDYGKTTLNINKNNGCTDASGSTHFMSVEQFSLSSPICVNVKMFQTIPNEDLKLQLSALFLHEFSHHFGFSEYDASKMQYYVLHNFRELSWFPETFSIDFSKLKNIEKLSIQNTYFDQIIFQDGKIKDAKDLNKDQPYCSVKIFFDPKEIIDIDLKKKTLNYELIPVTITFSIENASYDIVPGKSFSVFALKLKSQVYWDGDQWSDSGVTIKRQDKIKSKTQASSTMSCAGSNLRYGDLLKIFGNL